LSIFSQITQALGVLKVVPEISKTVTDAESLIADAVSVEAAVTTAYTNGNVLNVSADFLTAVQRLSAEIRTVENDVAVIKSALKI